MPYKIMHTVGNPASGEPWRAGDILADKTLQIPGVSIKRLLCVGAIEQTSEAPKLIDRDDDTNDDEYDDVYESPAGTDENSDGTVDDLEKLSVAELKTAATSAGIDGADGMKKSELLDALRAHQAAQ